MALTPEQTEKVVDLVMRGVEAYMKAREKNKEVNIEKLKGQVIEASERFMRQDADPKPVTPEPQPEPEPEPELPIEEPEPSPEPEPEPSGPPYAVPQAMPVPPDVVLKSEYGFKSGDQILTNIKSLTWAVIEPGTLGPPSHRYHRNIE